MNQSFRYSTTLLTILSLTFVFTTKTTHAYTYCGFGETYDYFSDSCKCSYGYVRTYSGCISDDQYCRDKYGYAASADYSGNCVCSSGFIMTNNGCQLAATYCSNKFGTGATYDILSKACECSSGYIMSGGRCEMGSLYCSGKFGINSSFSYTSQSCECRSGYILNSRGSKCISLDESCEEDFGRFLFFRYKFCAS